MDAVKAVSVRREQSARGHYDCIKVVIGDLHLRCDVTCDRDIRLAKRLADDHGAPFNYDVGTQDRVMAALGDSGEPKPVHIEDLCNRCYGSGVDPLHGSIRMAQVHAGEQAVIADLRRMGLA